LIKLKEKLLFIPQIKAGHYAKHLLNFSPKIRLGMLINVMHLKKNMYITFPNVKLRASQPRNLKKPQTATIPG